MRERRPCLRRAAAMMLVVATAGLATACKGTAPEEAPPEVTHDTLALPGSPAIPVDSIGDIAPGVRPAAGEAIGPVARLNVILAPETWGEIDDLTDREAALMRAIEELVTRAGGDSITVVSVEVSPAIGAVRLTLPDSLMALALAARLQTMTGVISADLDRREVRRHP